MNKYQKILKYTIFVGIALFAFSLVLQFTNPKAEDNLPAGFSTPIIAFEFIQNKEQVVAFFKVENVEKYMHNMHLGNKIDYIFMVIYSVFLFLIANYLYTKTKARILILAMILAPLACLFDVLENFQIYNIIKDIHANLDVLLSDLRLYTWLKWGSLAIIFTIFGMSYLKNRNKWFALIAIAPICIMPIAIFSYNTINEVFSFSVILNFLVAFIFVVLEYRKALLEIK